MRRNGTMIKRKPLKMTALSLAAAQVALMWAGSAQAQGSAGGDAVQTVVVTGQRGQVETAQRLKQEAEQIVDSVVADEAGKLPDKSITEVLQRVVGVTMDRNRSRTGANMAANAGGVAMIDLALVDDGDGLEAAVRMLAHATRLRSRFETDRPRMTEPQEGTQLRAKLP